MQKNLWKQQTTAQGQVNNLEEEDVIIVNQPGHNYSDMPRDAMRGGRQIRQNNYDF